MKQLLNALFIGAILLFTSCSSNCESDTIAAYKNAVEQLKSAKDNDDCQKVHEDLMCELARIGLEHPDYMKELIKSEKVNEAYKKWDKALQETTTDNLYYFLPYCTIDVALKTR